MGLCDRMRCVLTPLNVAEERERECGTRNAMNVIAVPKVRFIKTDFSSSEFFFFFFALFLLLLFSYFDFGRGLALFCLDWRFENLSIEFCGNSLDVRCCVQHFFSDSYLNMIESFLFSFSWTIFFYEMLMRIRTVSSGFPANIRAHILILQRFFVVFLLVGRLYQRVMTRGITETKTHTQRERELVKARNKNKSKLLHFN